MAGDDEDGTLAADDQQDVVDDDPQSGKRKRKLPSPTLRGFLAEFHERAEGLSGPALQAEVDTLIERMIENHVAVVPVALKDELRARMREMLENDPTLAPMLQRLRAAAEREHKLP